MGSITISTSRQPWLIKLFYTTFCNNTLQNDKSHWLAVASEEKRKDLKKHVHPQKCFYITCEVYMLLHRGGANFFSMKYSNFPENGVA